MLVGAILREVKTLSACIEGSEQRHTDSKVRILLVKMFLPEKTVFVSGSVCCVPKCPIQMQKVQFGICMRHTDFEMPPGVSLEQPELLHRDYQQLTQERSRPL